MSKRIYIASKLCYAGFMNSLRGKYPGLHFTARWPLMSGHVPDEPSFAPQFWQDDMDDIARSDIVLVWGSKEDRLRGALVEAGIGLTLGKQVIVVGDHPDYGTWQFLPQVRRFPDLPLAQVLTLLEGEGSPCP